MLLVTEQPEPGWWERNGLPHKGVVLGEPSRSPFCTPRSAPVLFPLDVESGSCWVAFSRESRKLFSSWKRTLEPPYVLENWDDTGFGGLHSHAGKFDGGPALVLWKRIRQPFIGRYFSLKAAGPNCCLLAYPFTLCHDCEGVLVNKTAERTWRPVPPCDSLHGKLSHSPNDCLCFLSLPCPLLM